MTKFKAGDRVRVVVTGNEGTIVDNFFTGWDVLMDTEPRKPDLHADWYYRTNDLELTEEADPRDGALDRIADVIRALPYNHAGNSHLPLPEWRMLRSSALLDVENIIRETGRL